jgi:hypothetical protein
MSRRGTIDPRCLTLCLCLNLYNMTFLAGRVKENLDLAWWRRIQRKIALKWTAPAVANPGYGLPSSSSLNTSAVNVKTSVPGFFHASAERPAFSAQQ